MGTEISVIGEYALYILYILLVISIGVFWYILQKKQLPIDVSDEDNKRKNKTYKVDEELLHKHNKHIVKNEVKPLKVKKEDVKKSTTKPIITISQRYKENIDLNSSLLVYKKDMPSIDDVKPDYFEYFKGQQLLIVEDNKINQKILLNVLKNINTPIDVANNGQEAIEKVLNEKKSYDMILMDISMPVMDGINATKHIRDDKKCNDIPIVTVTAFTSGLEIGQMFEAGANAFLTKPLDIHKLFIVMLLFLDNSKSDLPVEKEFEILGINLADVKQTMHVNTNELKETIEEFLKIPLFEQFKK
ncbi:MAG: response regulator [Campylobacterales bacterium]